MASTAAPFGLKPMKLVGNRQFAGATNLYRITTNYGTSIFTGDIVGIVAAGTCEKISTLGTAASQFPAGTAGVFVGCTYTDPSTKQPRFSQMWTGGTVASDAYAYVVDDPSVIYMIQASGQVPETARGANIGVVQTAGSTVYGTSKVAADVSTIGQTATIGLRIIDFSTLPGDAINDSFTNILVMFNPTQAGFQSSATGI